MSQIYLEFVPTTTTKTPIYLKCYTRTIVGVELISKKTTSKSTNNYLMQWNILHLNQTSCLISNYIQYINNHSKYTYKLCFKLLELKIENYLYSIMSVILITLSRFLFFLNTYILIHNNHLIWVHHDLK